MKHLLRIADLDRTELELLLDMAAHAKAEPHRFRHVLAGDSVVLHFAKPSTRTRISFETAVARLGGAPITTGPNELQLGRGETIEDTARVVSRYARAFVIRTFADDIVRRFAEAATIPVVNALTDGHHPCQALADLLTLREEFGSLRSLKVAYIGDGTNVAHSLVEACALAGVDVAVATPPGYECDAEVIHRASDMADRNGSGVLQTHDPLLAAAGADAVYTDVWVSMGDEAEQEKRLAAFKGYQVTQGVMGVAAARAVFMHCLPAHRGLEVASSVIDGPQSVVWDEAENRRHVQKALLAFLDERAGWSA
jgi:ornithine carbamoyltransferase